MDGTTEAGAVPVHMPTLHEAGLGRVEFDQVSAAATELADPTPKKRRVRGTYTQYSAEQRAKIGKFALENGNEKARKHFIVQFPNLKESTIRNYKKAYKQLLDHQRKEHQPQPVTKIPAKPRGRPPILLELDEKLIKFLRAVRVKGGVVNIHVVRATAKALIESNPSSSSHLQNFDMPRSWVQSIYRRMGYKKRAGTTARPPVPQGLYDESRRDYLGDIDRKIKQHKIPPELVFNSDQTPSSYVSVGKSTMTTQGSKSVPIVGLSDKRSITLNFIATLSNEFLPMQVIYSGKTKASLPLVSRFHQGSV